MFGRTAKRFVSYVVTYRNEPVYRAGNSEIHEDWTLEGLAKNFADEPGMRCLIWAGDVFNAGRVMGRTAASLEQQYGAPDAVAEG